MNGYAISGRAASGGGCATRFRCHAVLALEESCEVSLIREAGALRDIGENGIVGVEHATCALEAEMQQVSMRRQTEGLTKCTREVSGRELHFAGEELHRQIRVQLRIDQLERATFGDRRQSPAKSRHDWFAHASMERQLVTQSGGQRFDECETARISRIRLSDERAGDVCDLGFHNPIASPQLHSLSIGLGGDHSIEVDRIDRHPHVAEVAVEADRDYIVRRTDPRRTAA